VKPFIRNVSFLCLVLLQALAFNCGQSSPSASALASNLNNVFISISPGKYAVATGGTVQFTPSVSGTTKTGVTWSIVSSGTNTGSIDANGLYKAPDVGLPGPVTVEAKIVADPSKSASATVWVIAPGKVSTTNNPMVAEYSITAPDGAYVKIEFGPNTSYGLDTWSRPTPSGGGPVNILVAGMRAFTAYHMRADVALPGGTQFQDDDHTFQTQGPASSLIPQMTVTTSSSLTPQPGIEMLDLLGGTGTTLLHAVATDLQGNLIWYYDFDNQGGALILDPIKLLPNGDMMVVIGIGSQDAIGNPNDDLSVLREIDLAGNTIRQITIPELNQKLANMGITWSALTMHHDFTYIPEGPAKGHVIVIVNHVETINGTQVLGDALVDLDQNFSPVWVWDTFDHLDVNRHPYSATDWTHGNGIIYSPDDGNLLFSLRYQSWVIKIDYEDGQGSGDILWRFGYQGDFTMQNGASADWAYAQHYPIILSPNSTGTFKFGVFDNGNGRVFDDGTVCGTPGANPCYSRVPIFSLDETDKTTQVLWQDIFSVYAPFLGSMQVLDSNDVFFDIGAYTISPATARLMEVTQEASPQVVWQLDEAGQLAYRGEHLPSLYPGVQW
jgi:arylsulfate sulfotransferase